MRNSSVKQAYFKTVQCVRIWLIAGLFGIEVAEHRGISLVPNVFSNFLLCLFITTLTRSRWVPGPLGCRRQRRVESRNLCTGLPRAEPRSEIWDPKLMETQASLEHQNRKETGETIEAMMAAVASI